MRYIENEARIVWSASDLKAAAECEFAWLRAIDAKLGRVPAVEEQFDPTLERAGRLGIAHEVRTLESYQQRYGDAVVVIPEARSSDPVALAAAVARTREALASDAAEVIYQAAFATEEFVGFADFLVREPAETGGAPSERRWVVQDTKLARHARVTALMQLAAYVDQLDRLGVSRADHVELLLGDGTTSTHRVDDLLPVFELRRARLRALIADRRVDLGAAGEPIAWGDPRGDLDIIACGRCATCEVEVVASRDLLLVAGMRPVQRARLRAAGVLTIDALAEATVAPTGMNPEVFAMLRTQARLQLASPAGVPELVMETVGGETVGVEAVGAPAVPIYEVVMPTALAALPRPDRGDLFFDFEGDPLYTEPGAPAQWGIDYLFGWVDLEENYSALWAHSFAEEKAALERFLDLVALRRRQHPGLHIYHYAPYEPTHLLTMAARYGVREAEVDQLLRDGVFVDLYPIVRRALRVGSRSYSIKKLEPLYMGEEVRTSDVQRGDDSIVRYVEARALAEDGDSVASEVVLADLADYNRYDCVSTRRLRDWLVDRAREAGLVPSRNPEPDDTVYEVSPRAAALERWARDAPEADAQALRLAAAAIDYYPREAKSFWATHFLRLREPVSLWEDNRDVVVIDPTRSRVVEEWHFPETGRGNERRLIEIRGDLAPGTRLSAGASPFAVYELPAPFPAETGPRWIHAARAVKVIDVLDDGAVVEETAVDGVTWSELPLALTPQAPPSAGKQQSAIDEWADGVLASLPALPADPATDILARRPPRVVSGGLTASRGDDIDAIVQSVIDLDHSYLAVQGPPGTGKTYIGSHVIARLVAERGYKIGVVAQSHAVVENMLDRVVAAGVAPQRVGKAPKDPNGPPRSFTVFPKNGLSAFAEENAAGGYVVGGTAWDFSHDLRVPRQSLDLLVIDEAGQFSLASTIAVSLASSRLLLLGDPQQLPQVSQGTHPEPVDTSALGWVMDGREVVPPEYGYFLSRTWRMHPRVAAPVSRLSYEGKLAAHPVTALRSLEGVEPGLHLVPVRHSGNATRSPEEAAEVVRIVEHLVGRSWRSSEVESDGTAVVLPPRPLEASDIIVVTPYNAHQVTVEEALATAGFPEVRVGTVDRFQGQEAVVAIMSLAASAGRDAPRGLEFLLLRNRLNVGLSRAMQAAYLVYSPGLLDDLPRTPEGVARLSAFARLVSPEASSVQPLEPVAPQTVP
ncbi:TM0106 family RecB-like putative nuclease [Microbacterium sp. P04]|uniref:TM0106 family RecB-like putative nuclease n=1 Tax=Microbacterium sp. P04 TaxID=3366947 RepID=UPI0037477FB0